MVSSLSIIVSAALALFTTTASAMPNELRARNDCVAGNFFDGTDYPGQVFCYGAPSGRFQGFEGQAGVCGACCGWATTPGQINNNTLIVKCEDPTPFSGLASGSGCVETRQGCDPVDTCEQAEDGTCHVLLSTTATAKRALNSTCKPPNDSNESSLTNIVFTCISLVTPPGFAPT
ncbi:hypothetical protein DFH06DRAFT_1121901 [Mycena polygramma]|nr:hypothetical protein DFH06DRAFT_1121901 [Mycena polygramma]